MTGQHHRRPVTTQIHPFTGREKQSKSQQREIHMLSKMLGHVSVVTAALLGVGLGAWLFAAPSARALVDTAHVVGGGGAVGEATTNFQSPGLGNIYSNDFPAAGLGESAAQMLMPAGTLSKVRVKITTTTAPSSGAFTLMVRVNGADTVLTCQIPFGSTQCSTGNKTKGLLTNSPLAVRVTNNFVSSGNIAFTYTMQFD